MAPPTTPLLWRAVPLKPRAADARARGVYLTDVVQSGVRVLASRIF